MKRLICIGGGELKNRDSIPIDEYIAHLAKEAAGEARACGLFIPTASHDCMPYYNSFHKIYTGLFDIKTDVALSTRQSFDPEKTKAKFDHANFIYVGGGDTVFMIEHWKSSGLLNYIREAYERGVILVGLSAGAICWFEEMYSDSVIEGEYAMYPGLGWINGKISPHYDERMLDFDEIVLYNRFRAWGIENAAALEFIDGSPVRTIGSGHVFDLDATGGALKKEIFSA